MNIGPNHLSLAISLALGGLGVFLIAVKLMSNSLKGMSGGHTVKLMKKFSANRFLALGAGVLFTTMIQSSDGAVALAIGLIAAGFMDLRAAIPFILGANIGTATTSFIVYLGDVSFTQYFMILGFVGAMGYLIIKEEKKSNIAMLVFAIGAIFIGLKVMGTGMKAISSEEWFKDIITAVSSNTWGAMFTSTILTGLMQSSSATTTVIQGVYSGGAMGIQPAIAMIIGANIGTTFTALITSIGAGKEPKRIAVIWLFTNAVIALIIMPLLYFYSELVSTIVSEKDGSLFNTTHKTTPAYESSHKLQLAVSHIMFNGTLAAIFIWLVTPLAKMSEWVVKDKKSNFDYEVNLPMSLLNESPELAYEAVKKASYELGKMSNDSLTLLYKYFKDKDKEVYKKFKELEILIDITKRNIYTYLIELGSRDISKRLANKHMSLVLATRSLEKLPALGHQLATEINTLLTKNKKTKKYEFGINDGDFEDLKAMFKINLSLSKRAAQQIKRNSKKRRDEMIELYDRLEHLVVNAQKRHINRAKKEKLEYDFIGFSKTQLRIGHHSIRVSKYIRKGDKEIKGKELSDKLEKELLKYI